MTAAKPLSDEEERCLRSNLESMPRWHVASMQSHMKSVVCSLRLLDEKKGDARDTTAIGMWVNGTTSAMHALFATLDAARARCAEVERERDEARRCIVGAYVDGWECAWCGETLRVGKRVRFENARKHIAQHVLVCKKHPLRKKAAVLTAERDFLREQLDVAGYTRRLDALREQVRVLREALAATTAASFRLLVACLRADANEELSGDVDGSDMQGVRDVLRSCPDCDGMGTRDKLPHEDETLEDDNICSRCEGWGILPEHPALAATEGDHD